MDHSIFLLMEIDHSHCVGYTNDPSFDVFNALLFGEFGKVDRFTSCYSKLDCFVGYHTHL